MSCWAATSPRRRWIARLDELWAKLRITRVDYKQDEGVFWDVLFRWSPEAVKQGMHVSIAESLTALVSKYLDCVLAAQQEEVEQFFSRIRRPGAGARGASMRCRRRVSCTTYMSAAA